MVYNRILVPLDGSDHGSQTIPYARVLGKGLGARVELFRVFDPQPEYFWPNPSEYLQRHQAALDFREQATRWRMTSESEVDWKIAPSATKFWRRVRKLLRLPLWASPMPPACRSANIG